MASTVEKLRASIPVWSKSPETDMDIGGTTHFFTRIRKLPTAGESRETGLYFKKRLLRRMDTISYDHDAFWHWRWAVAHIPAEIHDILMKHAASAEGDGNG